MEDELKKRFNDFVQQENQLGEEIESLLDRAVDEYCMTQIQVFGVLMDIALTRINRPVIDEEE